MPLALYRHTYMCLQVFEIKNDAKMKRTRQRPLPSGRISAPHAVAWASTAGITGTALLACKVTVHSQLLVYGVRFLLTYTLIF